MDEVERIGRISITGDDHIPGRIGQPCFIGSPVSLTFLDKDLCSFACCDVPCVIFGVPINDDDFKVPVLVVEEVSELDG